MYDLQFRRLVINYYFYFKKSEGVIVVNFVKVAGISRSIFYKWLKEYNVDNNLINHERKVSKITKEIEELIINVYTNKSKIKPKNLRKNIKKRFNVSIGRSSIYEVLKRNKITYKRISTPKTPYNNFKLKALKKDLKKRLGPTTNNKIVSLDETSINLHSKPFYGWSKKGTRCIRKIKKVVRKRVSLILAISRKKVIGYKIVEKSVNGEIFKDFISDITSKKSNYNLLLDNARIHHYKKLKESITKTNNKLIYNIPYHPQSNPVEYIFSFLKNEIRQRNIDNMDKLKHAISVIIKKINNKKEMLNNCFNRAFNEI